MGLLPDGALVLAGAKRGLCVRRPTLFAAAADAAACDSRHGARSRLDSRRERLAKLRALDRVRTRLALRGTCQAFAALTALANHLQLTLEVHATESPVPASLGWHPWFRRQLARGDAARLDFEAASIFVLDESELPTGELRAPGPGPYDDCFTGVVRDPVLRWPGALEVTLSSDLDHWVVYDALPHAICVEPSSGPPDALNIAPRIVAPGEPLIGRFRLAWDGAAL